MRLRLVNQIIISITSVINIDIFGLNQLVNASPPQFHIRKPAQISVLDRNFDHTHMRLELRVDLKKQAISGVCTHTIALLKDNVTRIEMSAEDLVVTKVIIHSIKDNDAHGVNALHFYIQNQILVIELDSSFQNRPFKANEELRLEIHYYALQPRGLYFTQPNEKYPEIPYQVYTLGRFFPAYAESDERLEWESIYHVDPEYTVIANGEELAYEGPQVLDEQGKVLKSVRHQFKFSQTPYLVNLVVGQFDRQVDQWKDVRLEYYVPPGRLADVPLAYGKTPSMMEFYSQLTGVPYPYKIYRQQTVWDYCVGGFEFATASTLNLARTLIEPKFYPDYKGGENLVAHELAHQWFGNLITCKNWKHGWLNEGLTTYVTDMWFENHYGEDEFRKVRRKNDRDYMELSTPEFWQKCNLDPKINGREALMDREPGELASTHSVYLYYNKGSSVSHMLRGVVGDKTFQDIIKVWFQRKAHQHAVTEEFRKIAEEIYGKPLDWFFDEWIYGVGYPYYEVEWNWQEKSQMVYFRVNQTHPTSKNVGLFKMPVKIACGYQKGEVWETFRGTFWVDHAQQRISFPLPIKPTYCQFDEGGWIVKKISMAQTLDQWTNQGLHAQDLIGRIEAVIQIAEFGEDGIHSLAKILQKEKNNEVLRLVRESLGKINKPGILPYLIKGLEDFDSQVRATSAEVLGKLKIIPISEKNLILSDLTRLLRKDESYIVQQKAAEALGRLGYSSAYPDLIWALNQSSQWELVRQGAMVGLAALKNSDALNKMIEVLNYRLEAGGSHRLMTTGIDQIVELGGNDPKVIQKLTELVQDPFFRTRSSAVKALQKIMGRSAVPVLWKQYQIEPKHIHIKPEIEQALLHLAGKEK